MPIRTKKFWSDLVERLLKTVLQGAGAVGVAVVGDLEAYLIPAIMGALSALTSWLSSKKGDTDSASLLN